MGDRAIYILIGVAMVLSSCSSGHSKAIGRAEELGRVHARALIESQPMTDMELQYCMLEIVGNETELRETAGDDVAGSYISVFEKTVREECDSLAAIIF